MYCSVIGESILLAINLAERSEVGVLGFQAPGVNTVVKGTARVAFAFDVATNDAVLTNGWFEVTWRTEFPFGIV